MFTGTLVELDPIDALGWIALEDGRRVRVGGTTLARIRPMPEVGARLRVLELQPGFGGVERATRVEAVAPEPPPASPAAHAPPWITWSALTSTYPRWSELDAVSITPSLAVPPLAVPPHALFEPWRAELARTAPVVVPMSVPHSSAPRPIEASPSTTFALGEVAFLDTPTWPACGCCQAPLELCIQLSADIMQAFGGQGRGLAVLFCFPCGIRQPRDPAVAWVGRVRGTQRVARPAGLGTRASHPARATQAVTVGEPMRVAPELRWYTLRSEQDPESAASILLGFEPHAIEGPLPPALSAWVHDQGWERPLHPEDVQEAFEAWSEAMPGSVLPGGGHSVCLGGAPVWAQSDETPSCEEHGRMRLLLDYEGGQFLDGALHVFACAACDRIRTIAEF